MRVKNSFFFSKEYSGNSISRLTQAFSEVFHFAASIFFLFIFYFWEMNNGNSLLDFVYSDMDRFFAIALFMFLGA